MSGNPHIHIWVETHIFTYEWKPTYSPVSVNPHIHLWVETHIFTYEWKPTYSPMSGNPHIHLWVETHIFTQLQCLGLGCHNSATSKNTNFGYTRLSCIALLFTFTETVGLIGVGAQDSHLNFHTALELWHALHSYVGLYSAKISSLRDSTHFPEMEINPLKTMCGCPWGRVTKKIKVAHAIISPYGMLLSMYNCKFWVPHSVQLGYSYSYASLNTNHPPNNGHCRVFGILFSSAG